MALWGEQDWNASNMDLFLSHDPADGEAVRARFREGVEGRLRSERCLLHEEAVRQDDGGFRYERRAQTFEDLLRPRRGVWFDLSDPARIRVVWSHMQTDGVGIWLALKPLFDPNPPLVDYGRMPTPPPLLPELLALPRVARSLSHRGVLRARLEQTGEARTDGLHLWPAAEMRALRDQLGRSTSSRRPRSCGRCSSGTPRSAGSTSASRCTTRSSRHGTATACSRPASPAATCRASARRSPDRPGRR
jgi:hypothetical protein